MMGLTFLLPGKVIRRSKKNCLQDEHNTTILVVDTFLRIFGLVQLCGLISTGLTFKNFLVQFGAISETEL